MPPLRPCFLPLVAGRPRGQLEGPSCCVSRWAHRLWLRHRLWGGVRVPTAPSGAEGFLVWLWYQETHGVGYGKPGPQDLYFLSVKKSLRSLSGYKEGEHARAGGPCHDGRPRLSVPRYWLGAGAKPRRRPGCNTGVAPQAVSPPVRVKGSPVLVQKAKGRRGFGKGCRGKARSPSLAGGPCGPLPPELSAQLGPGTHWCPR